MTARKKIPPAKRRPGRIRRWLVRPLVWLLAIVLAAAGGGLLYLSSDAFAARIETLIEQRASDALGRAVTIEDLDLSILSLGAEARNLRIAGPTPDDPPLLTARRVAVDLSLVELVWRGPGRTALRLEQLLLESPRFELRFDRDGVSNLPDFSSAGGAGEVEIEMGRLLVQDGAFVYDEQRVPLTLDAREVWGQLEGGVFDADHPFAVRLSARSLETRLPATEPFTPAVSLEVRLFPDHLDLIRGRLEADDFEGDVSGLVRWREVAGETARVRLDIDARGAAGWANRLGYLEEKVAGTLRFDGRFEWSAEDWRYGGELTAARLDLLGRRFEDLRGELAGDARQVRVEVASARHAGGAVEGTMTLDLASASDPAGGRPVRIEARGEGLALRPILDDLGLELSGAAGRIDARFEYRFSTAAVSRGNGAGRVAVSGLRRPADRLGVDGDAAIEIRDGVLGVHDALVAVSAQTATADLIYDLERGTGALRWRLDSGDLGELASLLLADWRAEPVSEPGSDPGSETAPETEPPWWPRSGSGVLAGTLDLVPGRTVGRLSFELADVATPHLSVEALEGSFEHSPERLSNLEARAERGAGELWVIGEAALPEGEGEAVDLDLEIAAAGWPIATFESLLPAASGVQGGVNGRLSVRGALDRPVVTGSLWAEPLRIADLVIDRAEADLAWTGAGGRIERLLLEGPPGRLTGSGGLDLETGDLDLRIEVPALDLGLSETAAGLAAELAGTLTASASVTGTLESPAAELTLTARDLTLDGRPLGRQGTAEMRASWRGDRLDGEGSLLGLVRFDGGGRLDRETMDLSFSIESDRIEEIFALLVEPQPEVSGSFSGAFEVQGSWQQPEAIRGRLELSDLTLLREGHRIHNLQPVVAEVDAGGLDIENLFLGDPESESELFVAGTLGPTEQGSPLDLHLQTSLDAVWIEPLLPGIQIDGVLDALATIRGDLAAPRINGQGEIRNGRAILPGFPHALDDVSAILFFYPKELVLHELTARFASGRVRASGRIEMPRGDAPLVYDLQTEARNLSLRYPQGWTLRGGADLRLRAPAETGERELGGTVRLDRAFYVEDVPVGLLQLVQGALRRQRLALQETDEMLASTQLALAIEGPEALRVRNNVADLSGDLSLSLRGTLARPVVLGEVDLERGGTLLFRDNEYKVERGRLTFANPYEIEPVIDLVATTEVRRYDVQLTLSGTLDRLNASFSSNPQLADLEILGLLTTGAEPGTQAAQGQAAERFLFGQAASALSRRVSTLFGFDRFRINPGEGDEIASGIGFAVEKRLSRDVTVIFSRDPASTERELLQVAWDITEDVTLLLTREGDGSFALDARWERGF